jgi:hypothetical protein
MKFQAMLLTCLTMILLISSNAVFAQLVDQTTTFQISPQHELSIIPSGSLTWNEDSSNTLTFNLTMSDYEFNNSEIKIITIVFIIIDEPSNQPITQIRNSTQISLTQYSNLIQYTPSFVTPVETDRFFVNVTLLAIPSGGGVDETQNFYSFRFPQESSIIVQRDNIVPAINLYGFPQGSFFANWLPFYFTSIFILISPIFVVLYSNYRSSKDKENFTKKNMNTLEETNND